MNKKGRQLKAPSIQATAQLLDDLAKVCRVLFDDPSRFFQPRRFGRWLIVTRLRLFWP
jgi:hypothetical protein